MKNRLSLKEVITIRFADIIANIQPITDVDLCHIGGYCQYVIADCEDCPDYNKPKRTDIANELSKITN